MEIDLVNDTITPITDKTFKKQKWEKYLVGEEENLYYWSIPLPKDNPDSQAPCLVSSVNDDWEYLGIPKGTYTVTIYDMSGLGKCMYEEDIEDLYMVLTGEELIDNKNKKERG